MDILIRSHRISRRIFACALLRYRPEKKYSPHFLEDVFIFRISFVSFAFIVQILHSILWSRGSPRLLASSQCRRLHRKMVEEYSEMRFFSLLLLLFGFAFFHSIFYEPRRLSEIPHALEYSFLAVQVLCTGVAGWKIRFLHLTHRLPTCSSVWIFAFSMFSRNAKLLFCLGYCYCNDFLCSLWANEWMHGMAWHGMAYGAHSALWLWWRSPQVDFHNRVVHINAGRP